MSDRTFIVKAPLMNGEDVKAWQETLNRQLRTWKVEYQLDADGEYGTLSRDLTASVCHGLGLASATAAMKNGVTPELRKKIGNKELTAAERERYHDRAEWRIGFRERHAHKDIAPPLIKINSSDWGWHKGVHDGVDLICPEDAPIFAICRAQVIRVAAGGWWGAGPVASPGHPISDGDGIIILRSLVNVGPFKKGLNFAYGHAEKAKVKVGEIVEAGAQIGHAGFARAAHVHFMVNGRPDDRGVGDRDPMPFVRYAMARA